MYLLNIDWLEPLFVMDYPELFNSPQNIYINKSNLSLVKCSDLKYYSNQYFNCFDIVIDKIKVGHLHKDPIRNPLFKKRNIISIRFNNFILYEGNLHSIIETLLESLKLSFYGYSRIDICIDTEENILSRFKDFYNDTSTLSFKNRGNMNVIGTGKLDSITTIGSLKNRKRTIMIYDKTLELDKGNKQYIKEIHKEVFNHNQVYRIELRLFNKGFNYPNKEGKEILYIDILKLSDKNYLEGIFKLVLNEMIDFRRINKSDSCITRHQRVDFMELNNSSEFLKRRLEKVEVHNNSYSKYLIKTLHNDSRKDEFKPWKKELLKLRDMYIKKYRLNEYYKMKLELNDK
jgi:hypothetical protein